LSRNATEDQAPKIKIKTIETNLKKTIISHNYILNY
jgi:hypothetical protein